MKPLTNFPPLANSYQVKHKTHCLYDLLYNLLTCYMTMNQGCLNFQLTSSPSRLLEELKAVVGFPKV